MTEIAGVEWWENFYVSQPHSERDWYIPTELVCHALLTNPKSLLHDTNYKPPAAPSIAGTAATASTAPAVAATDTKSAAAPAVTTAVSAPTATASAPDSKSVAEAKSSATAAAPLRVLHIGCGSSEVTIDLYDRRAAAIKLHAASASASASASGPRALEITNVDFSPAVISAMTAHHATPATRRPGFVFESMDVRQMTYAAASFDMVLDKGTLDCVILDKTTGRDAAVNQMFTEISRVLKSNGGQYWCFSLYGPDVDARLKLLSATTGGSAGGSNKYGWTVEYIPIDASPYEIPDQKHTHLYLMIKK